MNYGLIFVLLSLACIDAYFNGVKESTLLNRFVRGVNSNKKQECRYEKQPWEECDLTTGQQKRVLKLKTSRSTPTHCEQEKFIQRLCKKNCRYAKGVWTECTNGSKQRIDNLKSGTGPTVGCESTRNVTKTCKEPCHYEKSDWSPCDNGIKTKTLTLVGEGNANPGCEATKTIRKQCGNAKPGRNRQRGKKNNQNVSPIDS